MSLTSLPAVGAGQDLGPTKSDARTVTDTSRQMSAAEWNAAATAIEEVCAEVGLGDGSTAGSLVARMTAAETAIDANAIASRSPAKIACLGDSLSSLASSESATEYAYDGTGYMTWANIFLGQRLHFEHALNFGGLGETATEIAARVGDVVAAAPDVCVAQAGGNDAIQKVASSTTIAALQSMYETLIAAGILVVTFPILPQGAAWWAVMTPEEATTQRLRISRINRWIRSYARENAGIVMADPNGALIDVDSADSTIVAEMFAADALHPSIKGAQHIGQTIADALSEIVAPAAPTLPEHNIDMYDATENPEGNLLTNGMMTGTGGTVTAEVTGVAADSWTARNGFGTYGAGTVVASKEARTDGVNGDWQVFTLSGLTGGGNLIYVLRQEVLGSTGYYTQGDTIEAEAEIEVSGATYVHGVTLLVREFDGSGTAVRDTETGLGSTDRYTDTAWSGIYRTPAMPISAAIGASSKLRVDINIRVAGDLGAAAVVKIGRVDLRKVT